MTDVPAELVEKLAEAFERTSYGDYSSDTEAWLIYARDVHASAIFAAGEAAALTAAADDVRRIRTEGLRPDERSGPYTESFEQWLRARVGARAVSESTYHRWTVYGERPPAGVSGEPE